jgi:hypothetical protein
MTVPAPGPNGWLHVEVKADSYFLSNNLPVVVRDARGAVVLHLTSGATEPLPAGLYSVAAVTPDGEGAVKHAHIGAAETTSVTFEAPETVIEQIPGTESLTDVLRSAVVLAEVVSADGCTVVPTQDAAGLVFVPEDHLYRVPSAVFRIGDRRIRMSLPLNPSGDFPLNSCQVGAVTTGRRTGLRMSFPPERRVTRLVDGLVRHGEITAGVSVLQQASELLCLKFSDPAGAALGGLTLDRMGLLDTRSAWVENLARGFPWLPDGRVLLASLLRHASSPAERQRGLGLLLAAASELPLYTDGLSLLMELLRRWPDEASKNERHDMLDKLAEHSAYADWDSVNLSVELPAW